MVSKTWRRLSLGEVVTLQRGYDLPHRERKHGTIPIISSSGSIDTHNESRAAGPGVVTGRYGTIGEVFFISEDFWPLNTTLFVKDFKGNNPLFISFLLRTIDYQSHSGKSGVPGVNRNDLHEINVCLPPLPEQEAIATALSDVDALITSLNKLITKKRDIKQATMLHLLTGKTRLPEFSGDWDVKILGEITQSTAGGTPSTLIREYWGGNIKWMNSGELNEKKIYDVKGRITKEGLENSSTKIIPSRCVLVGLAGQGKTRGTVAINMVELCTNQSIAAIFPSDQFIPEYLYFNLDSRYDELRNLSTGEGGRGGLNLHIINSLMIPLPSLPEQRAIASILSDMDAEITALEQKRDKYRALKQGMMQELLTGRTRLK